VPTRCEELPSQKVGCFKTAGKAEDSAVVNAKSPHDPQPSNSDFNIDKAIKKETQEAQSAASALIHT